MKKTFLNWYYSVFSFFLYLATFHLWHHFKNERINIIIGSISVLVFLLGAFFSYKKSYFINKTDISVHLIVVLDVFLETHIKTVQRVLEFLSVIEEGRVFEFWKGHGFYACIIEFTVIIWIFRYRQLRKRAKLPPAT